MQKVFGLNCLNPDILREEYQTQFKQNQNKVNLANLLKRYTYKTNSISMSWCSGFVFKDISHRRFKFKKCSKFITMRKDISFGNRFESYDITVFDTMKFVTL